MVFAIKGTKFVVMAPIHVPEGRTLEQQLKMYVLNGYARMFVKGDFQMISEYSDNSENSEPPYLVIDRLTIDDAKDAISRLVDSAETAFYEGNGECRLMFLPSMLSYDFSMKFEADGISFEEPNDNMFSFNSPAGACP